VQKGHEKEDGDENCADRARNKKGGAGMETSPGGRKEWRHVASCRRRKLLGSSERFVKKEGKKKGRVTSTKRGGESIDEEGEDWSGVKIKEGKEGRQH